MGLWLKPEKSFKHLEISSCLLVFHIWEMRRRPELICFAALVNLVTLPFPSGIPALSLSTIFISQLDINLIGKFQRMKISLTIRPSVILLIFTPTKLRSSCFMIYRFRRNMVIARWPTCGIFAVVPLASSQQDDFPSAVPITFTTYDMTPHFWIVRPIALFPPAKTMLRYVVLRFSSSIHIHG